MPCTYTLTHTPSLPLSLPLSSPSQPGFDHPRLTERLQALAEAQEDVDHHTVKMDFINKINRSALKPVHAISESGVSTDWQSGLNRGSADGFSVKFTVYDGQIII